MGPRSWLELGALAVAGASLAVTYLRGARMQGAERQRVRTLEAAIAKLASSEGLAGLALRFEALEAEVKLLGAEAARIAVIDSKLDGLDRLVSRDLDEIKTSVRALQDRPPAAARARRAAAGA
jgi:hypothetical protein